MLNDVSCVYLKWKRCRLVLSEERDGTVANPQRGVENGDVRHVPEVVLDLSCLIF